MSNKLRRHELEGLFFGEVLGEGMSRKVYVLNEPSTWGKASPHVVKVETASRVFQNVAEWEIWNWVQGTPLAKWFAPCVSISACGLYLIQKRTEPIREAERPRRLPAFLCDLKRENFGMLDGRIVCCDYGTGVSAIRSVDKRLKKAKWHG